MNPCKACRKIIAIITLPKILLRTKICKTTILSTYVYIFNTYRYFEINIRQDEELI